MTRANADMRFYTNGHTNERMRIDASGNVTIKASGADASRTLSIQGANGASQTYQFNIVADGENSAAKFMVGSGGGAASEVIRIANTGQLLVGSGTSPASGEVKQTLARAGSSYLEFQNTSTNTGSTIGTSGENFIVYTNSGALGSETYTERLRIESDGDIQQGTYSDTTVKSLQLRTNKALLTFEADGATNTNGSSINYSWVNGGQGPLNFKNASSTVMTLDASGNLLVGTTDEATYNLTSGGGTALWGNGLVSAAKSGAIVGIFNRTSSDGDILQFRKDGTTVGSIGSASGVVSYIVLDPRTGVKGAGLLGSSADANTGILQPTDNSGSAADASIQLGTVSNRFKDIWLSGKIAKGTGGELDLRSDGGGFNYKQNLDVATAGCTFTGQSTRGDVAAIRLYQTATGADGGYIRLDTCNAGSTTPTEKARIDASGSLLVGGTAYPDGTDTNWGVNAGGVQASSRTTTSTAIHYTFYNTNGAVGTITTNGSATAYNTSSDQRLKENIVDAPSASSDIDAIQVRSFDWKADGSHQKYGMVAQELQTVAPEAVSAPEDPEEMMGVDYSKLVPMLVKEIQSLRARVAQLES
jgi:hypothetical protein